MFASVFLAPWMLLGLVALAVPIIIHLLNRRRFDVIEWGAMQFLQISDTKRRRVMLEDILLLALRLALLTVLVLALAGPFFDTSVRLGKGPTRDVVFILDGSASMSAGENGASPTGRARDRLRTLLDTLGPEDEAALILARERPVDLTPGLSLDRDSLRSRLDNLPEPGGSADWSAALKRANALLTRNRKAERDIVLLSDNQKFGFADADALFRWELLSREIRQGPRLWYLNVGGERSGQSPNYALGPLTTTRAITPIQRELTLRGSILVYGQERYEQPHRLRLEVDGEPVRTLAPPPTGVGEKVPDGYVRVPYSFALRFDKPGSHLVRVILEADPPNDERPPDYVLRDSIPADNRADYAIEALAAIPVLIVDGENSVAPPTRLETDFLRDALTPARDPTPAVQATVVRVKDFSPARLRDKGRPRVLILHNVERLSSTQQESVATFAAEGGGVLVALGTRVDAEHANAAWFRNGDGWLPERLDKLEGDEAKPDEAMRPAPATFGHPALTLFQKEAGSGLSDARFPRWWRLADPDAHSTATIGGKLRQGANEVPFLIEKNYRGGRVLVCAVPLDDANGGSLPRLPAYVPLVHELVYYLAGTRAADYNLKPGQPIRYLMDRPARLSDFRLRPPVGDERPLSAEADEQRTYRAELLTRPGGATLIYDGARYAGVYRLQPPEGGPVHYVMPANPDEADLTPCSAEDRERVGKLLGMRFTEDADEVRQAWLTGVTRQELWAELLVVFILLLCVETWMTRRLLGSRQ